MPYSQKTGKKMKKIYHKPTNKPWSRTKAHFLDAHPDILAEFSQEKRKKWEGRINIARKEEGFKPYYDRAAWNKFYREG
jgi:hypothetical protein